MAITLYTGVPGAGKSYAMVSQVIVPAVLNGRTVRTNIDGLKPDAVLLHCEAHPKRKGELGKVEIFHGEQAKLDSFWPTEETGDADTVVKRGDLLVFDEWRLYFKPSGSLPTERLEAFLRWHRHLTDEKGVTCDVVIGTQLSQDIHKNFRGLVEASYRFRKLKAMGLPKVFSYDVYTGHLQNKESFSHRGKGKYSKHIFPLYKSYDGDADGDEQQTDARQSIWGKALYGMIAFVVLLIMGGIYGMYSFFTGPDLAQQSASPGSNNVTAGRQQTVAMQVPRSPFRIAGQLVGDDGNLVVLVDDSGAIRLVSGNDFEYRDGRPVSGQVDGVKVTAEDRFKVSSDVVEFGL